MHRDFSIILATPERMWNDLLRHSANEEEDLSIVAGKLRETRLIVVLAMYPCSRCSYALRVGTKHWKRRDIANRKIQLSVHVELRELFWYEFDYDAFIDWFVLEARFKLKCCQNGRLAEIKILSRTLEGHILFSNMLYLHLEFRLNIWRRSGSTSLSRVGVLHGPLNLDVH